MARSNQTPIQTAVAPKKPGQRRKLGSAHADPAVANCAPIEAHKHTNVTNGDVDSDADALKLAQTMHSLDANCRLAIDQLERALATVPGDGAKGIALAVIEANQPYLFLNGVFEDCEWQVCNAKAIQQIREKLFLGDAASEVVNQDVVSSRHGVEGSLSGTSCNSNVQTARRRGKETGISTHPTSKRTSPGLSLSDYAKHTQSSAVQPQKRPLSSECSSDSESSDSDDEQLGETMIDMSFRVNDREAVKKYFQFRLHEFPGVLLKDIVSNWVKMKPEWKGFQKAGELQHAPPSWPEGVCFIGVHRLKKKDVIKLGAHVLTRFYYDEKTPMQWPAKLQKKIESYLYGDDAKFSSSSNSQTKEENRFLVINQIFPELWENLRKVDEYEAMCRECEVNGYPPPANPDTVTYHPFRRRNKKKTKNEKVIPVRQKKPARQQKPRRSRATNPKKAAADSLGSGFKATVPLVHSVEQGVQEQDNPQPESHDTEMQDEFRAPSPSPTIASDGGFHSEHGIPQEQGLQNPGVSDIHTYSSFAQRSSKPSFSYDPDMQAIPSINTTVNPWTESHEFGFHGQFHEPDMGHGQLQSFYPDVTEYPHACPPATASFSSVAYSEHVAEPQPLSHMASPTMGSFRRVDVYDGPQATKTGSGMQSPDAFAAPSGMFTNTAPAGFAQYAVSIGFAESGFYGTAPAPGATGLQSATPNPTTFIHAFSNTFPGSTQTGIRVSATKL